MHAGGRRFDPVWLHHFQIHPESKGIAINVNTTVTSKVTAKQTGFFTKEKSLFCTGFCQFNLSHRSFFNNMEKYQGEKYILRRFIYLKIDRYEIIDTL